MEILSLQKNKQKKFHKIIRYIFDILFPSFCVRCKKEGNFLCNECNKHIIIKKFIDKPPKHFPLTHVYAPLHYNNPLVSSLIINLKYNKLRDIHYYLAYYITKHLQYMHFQLQNDMIITYVPLHHHRLLQRGFDQSELIARSVAHALQIPFLKNILQRKRYTIPQTKVAQKQKRLQNVIDAFLCSNAKTIKNKTVLLIDDVMTTGATLGECAKILKQAGAKKVIGCVAAR